MSFTSRKLSVAIGTGSMMTGTLTAVDEEPALNNEGWDALTVKYVKRVATLTAEDCAALFPIGAQLGARKWWIVGSRPVRIAAGWWMILVDFKGWAASKPKVVRVGAAAEQQTGENILAPAYVGDTVGTVYAKVQTHENTPTIAVSYLVENVTTVSNTEFVGTQVDPPVDIAGIDVPDTVWAWLTIFTYHWPNGWVLMSSEQDRLPGTNVALVTDHYKFVRDQTPG